MLSVFLTLTACSRLVIYPGEQTATAIFAQITTQAGYFAATATQMAIIRQTSEVHPTPSDSPSPTPDSTPTPAAILTSEQTQDAPFLYYSQAGDTLPALAFRFGVSPESITSPDPIPDENLLSPNQLLIIPNQIGVTSPASLLMPDSEVVYSPSAIDFDMPSFIKDAGGYLSTYKEELSFGWKTSAEVIQLVAIENSINPRILLAILEYQSGWVYGQPRNLQQTDYPMGHADFHARGLYRQLSWAVQHLSIGYYGWRAGILSDVTFSDGTKLRLAPQLNAGTVALQTFIAQGRSQREWESALYAAGSITELYETMFGNPWLRAQTVEPLYPPSLTQPPLELPFKPGAIWSFTGGPHSAWGPDGALAAIDFAPATDSSGCVVSYEPVTPMAPGLVVRSENGVVVVDLDGDGREQTGWAIMYLHISSKNRVPVGNWVEMGQVIGYPSCEGGVATGTHVHVARKFNGEWILADGPLPFVLSGWRVIAGDQPYFGSLVKGNLVIPSSQVGSFESRIVREP